MNQISCIKLDGELETALKTFWLVYLLWGSLLFMKLQSQALKLGLLLPLTRNVEISVILCLSRYVHLQDQVSWAYCGESVIWTDFEGCHELLYYFIVPPSIAKIFHGFFWNHSTVWPMILCQQKTNYHHVLLYFSSFLPLILNSSMDVLNWCSILLYVCDILHL